MNGSLAMETGIGLMETGLKIIATSEVTGPAALPVAAGGASLIYLGQTAFVEGLAKTLEGISDLFTALPLAIQGDFGVRQPSSTPKSSPSPLPTPTPAPSPSPSSSIIGTYSANLVPSDVIGDPDTNSQRTVKVTFNNDGSGSLYISSFQGNVVSVSFPLGTAQYDSSGGLLTGIHYAVNADWSIDIGASEVENNGQQIVADIDYDSQNTPDGIFFIQDTLDRQ